MLRRKKKKSFPIAGKMYLRVPRSSGFWYFESSLQLQGTTVGEVATKKKDTTKRGALLKKSNENKIFSRV